MPIPEPRVMGNMHGREDAIRALRCIDPAASGCGRQITIAEFDTWDRLTRNEYRQSGWCLGCQNEIFKDPEEDECICDWVDVGLSVMMPMPYNDFCPTHGNTDLFDELRVDYYDPDMREDDPPSDIHQIQWVGDYV